MVPFENAQRYVTCCGGLIAVKLNPLVILLLSLIQLTETGVGRNYFIGRAVSRSSAFRSDTFRDEIMFWVKHELYLTTNHCESFQIIRPKSVISVGRHGWDFSI